MTEIVTINAAREAQQQALLAQRSDAAPREKQQQNTIQISQAGVQPDARRAAQGAEAGGQQNGQQDLSKRSDRGDQGLTGPSRPRVEIRDFDVGRTPAEVVGTVDVVQRFDQNSDGRIDLTEANRATRARNTDSSTFTGLAAAKLATIETQIDGPTQAEVDAALAEKAVQKPTYGTVISADPTLRAEREAQSNLKFGPGSTNAAAAGVDVKKYADKADASQGYVSGEQAVPEKYFGKGAEAVLGQFAAVEQPQKFADKAAASEPAKSFEASSGEAKYSDKVAQTETDLTGDQQPGQQQTFYDRAQDVKAGLGDAPSEVRKTYSGATIYSNAPGVSIDGKPLVVQVTA